MYGWVYGWVGGGQIRVYLGGEGGREGGRVSIFIWLVVRMLGFIV